MVSPSADGAAAATWTTGLKAEALTIFSLALPITLTFLCNFGLAMGSMLLVGRISAEALAATALSSMFANATGYSIAIGTASACDTLCSQAFGAQNYARVGLVTQRGVAVLLTLGVPIAVLWWFGGAVLLALGQSPEIVALAVPYLRLLIIGLPAALIYEVLKRHLQSLNISTPTLVIAIVAAVFNLCLGSLLIFATPLGFYGSPISISATHWLSLCCTIFYLRNHRAIGNVVTACRRACPGRGNATAPLAALASSGGAAGEPDMTTLHDVVDVDITSASASSAAAGGAPPAGGTARGGSEAAIGAVCPPPPPPSSPPPLAFVEMGDAGGEGRSASAPRADASAADAAAPARPALELDDLLDATFSAGISLRQALSDWPEFLILGLPSALLLLTEWGSYEFGAIIAGLCGVNILAEHTIIAMTASLSFMPALGLGVATGIRIGQLLGQQQPQQAMLAGRAVVVLVTLFAAANAVFILCVSPAWGFIFTEDDAVASGVSRFLWVLSIYTLFDAWQCVLCGMLRGLGRPALGAAANVFSWIIIALPLSYLFAITLALQLAGVWLAFCIAVFCCCASMAPVLVLYIDWTAESDKALRRAEKDRLPASAPEQGGAPPALTVRAEKTAA